MRELKTLDFRLFDYEIRNSGLFFLSLGISQLYNLTELSLFLTPELLFRMESVHYLIH